MTDYNFATISDAEAATIPTQSFLYLAGYNAAGDGGGGLYAQVATEPTHEGKFQSADGAWWELSEETPTPLMFGAVRGYSIDCTTAIQNCIDYAAAKNNNEVLIPAGVYKTTDTLLVPSNLHVRGEGIGATIIRSPNVAFPGKIVGSNTVFAGIAMVAVTNASVSDLTIDHQTDTGPDIHGIIIDQDLAGHDSFNCMIVRCQVLFTSARGHYLFWSRKAHGTKILFCYGDGATTTSNAGTTQEGIEVYGGDDVLVLGNTIQNVGNNSYYVNPEPTFSGAASNIRIIGNYSYKAQFAIRAVAGSDIAGLVIEANQAIMPFNKGIEIDAGSGATVSGVIVVNNRVSGGTINCYLDNSGGGTTKNVLIESNTFTRATDTGSGAVQSVRFNNFVIRNNDINNALGHAIQVIDGTNVQIIQNRVLTAQKSGLNATTGGGTLSNLYVDDNQFLKFNAGNGGDAGVQITNCAGGTARRNTFDTDNTAAYCVYVRNTTCDRIIVARNICAYDPGSLNPVFRNSGTNPNIGTFGPPAVLAPSITVSNTLVNYSSQVSVTQTAGTPTAFLVTVAPSSFTVTFPLPGAIGNETFSYEIA